MLYKIWFGFCIIKNTQHDLNLWRYSKTGYFFICLFSEFLKDTLLPAKTKKRKLLQTPSFGQTLHMVPFPTRFRNGSERERERQLQPLSLPPSVSEHWREENDQKLRQIKGRGELAPSPSPILQPGFPCVVLSRSRHPPRRRKQTRRKKKNFCCTSVPPPPLYFRVTNRGRNGIQHIYL